MKRVVLSALFILLMTGVRAQMQTPHILVNDGDRQGVLEKMEKHPWAKTIYDNMVRDAETYVNRHQTDPEWILSRYLMNRIPGKRYTQFYSDASGQGLVRYGGDAPVPTIRMSTWLRSPITEKGTGYRKPSVEELIPYDTARFMPLFNPETGQKEMVDPKAFVTSINSDINELALKAAIIFWLTKEEKYARFAADILNQWAQGAYYQEPIIGACRTGYLDMQTLGDESYKPLILAYDFVKTYMRQKGYELKWYETVFEKFASTLAFRGYWNNNWYAAESTTLVAAALSLEDKQKRDYYLQFFLERDTINGGCGQLALPSTVEKWLTHDGHWKEPGGYHNYPVGNLLEASMALEKNGYDIFSRFPALFRASYAMLKYSFPNLTVGAFGDTGRASQSAESLEIGLAAAIRDDRPEKTEMLASMKKLIDGGKYSREESGYLGLLCFLPEIPQATTTYQWPRTGTLEFARLFLQRNGMDPETGLMVGVQGATYNHNHCNGMAMELYGCGDVMGIDAGTGANYEHPLHRNYYAQWAAHNTVVAAGASSSIPFSGAAGSKNIGQIELAAMEPMSDLEAVSPACSFTDTRYLDASTQTNQSRTLAIIRISPSAGYYVDIYRSDNQVSNDYVYHNTGDRVEWLDEKGNPLPTIETTYPVTEMDYPGFRFFSDVRKVENHSGNLTARFSIHNAKEEKLYMQALVAGNTGRTYFQAKSMKTKTSGRTYNGKELPLFTIRTEAEAKSKPFVVVYEPYKESDRKIVEKITADQLPNSSTFTALTVHCKGNLTQRIYQSTNPGARNRAGAASFSGYFGVAGYAGDKLTSLYLGQGTEISDAGYAIRTQMPGAASITLEGKRYLVNANQETTLDFPVTVLKASLRQGNNTIPLSVEKTATGIRVTIPAVREAYLEL